VAHLLTSAASWRNIPQPVYEAVETLAKALEETKKENAELKLRLGEMERRQERLEAQLVQVDAQVKKAEEPRQRGADLREVLERVQAAAAASARAAEDEAELARRVDALERSRAQLGTKILSIDKARRQRCVLVASMCRCALTALSVQRRETR